MPELLRYRSYKTTFGKTLLTAKALALKYVFENYKKRVYEYDLIAGSRAGCLTDEIDKTGLAKAHEICGSLSKKLPGVLSIEQHFPEVFLVEDENFIKTFSFDRTEPLHHIMNLKS